MIGREEITTLLERPRAVTFAYVDGRGPEPQVVEEQRRDAVTRRLREAGAPDDDARAIEDALEREPGLPAPSSRYVLAEDGEIILDESLPGPRSGPELLGHSMLPPVLPLLRDRTDGIRYLVVEAGRGSAEVRVERAGREPEWAETVEGRTDALPKVSVGGWSQANYQRSSEQIWKQNEADVAELVDALTQQHSPEFIVISGDIRARQLLIDQLGVAARKLVIVVDSHTHAAGADRESLDRAIEEAIQDHLQRSEDAVDTAASEGAGRSGARGLGPVVEALREARVERLLLDARMQDSGRTLDALDRAPWIAFGEQDALDAQIVEHLPEAEALARAALLTGADVIVAEDHPADDEAREPREVREPVAALRWPDG